MDIENVKMSEDEQIIYFQGLAAIANANGRLDAEEINFFKSQKDELKVSKRVRKAAKAAIVDPPAIDALCKTMSKTDIKYTLYLDATMMAYADGIVCVDEETALKNLANRMKISDEQAEALREFADVAIKAERSEGQAAEVTKKSIANAGAGLAAVGVPLTAIAVSGKVAGLSAAGITSGLAALGLGMGMASGIGMVAVLGVAASAATYKGVRKIFG